jgi:hypothetical protein
VLQSAIPTRPRFEDLSSLKAYEGDPDAAGEVQPLAPEAPSPPPLTGEVDQGVPLAALREAGGARPGGDGRSKALALAAAVLLLGAAIVVVLWLRRGSDEGGATIPVGPEPRVPATGIATPSASANAVSAPPNATATASMASTDATSVAPSVTNAPSTPPDGPTPSATASPRTAPTPSSAPPRPPSSVPTGWDDHVVP